MRKVNETFEGGCPGIGGEVTESRLYSAYCDESCHLERDEIPAMALAAMTCPEREVRDVAKLMCESTSKGIERWLRMGAAQS